MKIKWLVQDVGIQMANIEDNFNALVKLGYDFSNFGLIANQKIISNLENILLDPAEQFIIRGGTKILKILENIDNFDLQQSNGFLSDEQMKYSREYIEQLKSGIFYDEKAFDQAYYGSLDLPLLNSNASLYPIKDNLNLKFNQNMFLKPSKDQKAFTAGILEAGQTIENFVKRQRYQLSYLDEIAVVAPCKTITSEYRFFVVEKEVITGSMYRLAGAGNISPIVPDNIRQAANEYAKLYQPHDVFTMDLAETLEGISIVEYNCWNASGLYKTDIPKIFDAVHEYKKQTKNKPKFKF